MTRREKILAASVGMMLVVVIGFFALTRVGQMFTVRNNSIARLEEELFEKERTVRLGQLASRRLGEFEARSLPPDQTLAPALYQAWLLELANKVELNGVNVSALPGRAVGDVYYRYGFMVSGQGDLRKLTDFLHEFYSLGYLHRISRMSVKPASRSKQLDLSITILALSMNSAPETLSLNKPPSDRLKLEYPAEYADMIVSRNLFGPANNAPKLAYLSTRNGNPEKEVAFRMRGEDPDADKLVYSIEQGPEGAEIDPDSGDFRWTPTALGKYEVRIRVSDAGFPSKSDVETVAIDVVEPPPAPTVAEFDPATVAVVTGITDAGGQRQVWVSIRTEGRVVKLFEGDELRVGSLDGTVRTINVQSAEIETQDGRLIRIQLGETLLPVGGTTLGGV